MKSCSSKIAKKACLKAMLNYEMRNLINVYINVILKYLKRMSAYSSLKLICAKKKKIPTSNKWKRMLAKSERRKRLWGGKNISKEINEMPAATAMPWKRQPWLQISLMIPVEIYSIPSVCSICEMTAKYGCAISLCVELYLEDMTVWGGLILWREAILPWYQKA